MKNTLLKVKTLLLGKKEVVMTNDVKIQVYKDKVDSLFNQFVVMNNSLTEVNENLQSVIEEEENNVKLAMERIELAQLNKEANEKVQEKVKEFIV